MNNSTFIEFCFDMIKRIDIEKSKNNVVMNVWLLQINSYISEFWTNENNLYQNFEKFAFLRTFKRRSTINRFRIVDIDIFEIKCNVENSFRLKKKNNRYVDFCDNFFDIFNFKFREIKKSINHIFMICIHIENQNQKNFYSFVLLKISVFHEFFLEHLEIC